MNKQILFYKISTLIGALVIIVLGVLLIVTRKSGTSGHIELFQLKIKDSSVGLCMITLGVLSYIHVVLKGIKISREKTSIISSKNEQNSKPNEPTKDPDPNGGTTAKTEGNETQLNKMIQKEVKRSFDIILKNYSSIVAEKLLQGSPASLFHDLSYDFFFQAMTKAAKDSFESPSILKPKEATAGGSKSITSK